MNEATVDELKEIILEYDLAIQTYQGRLDSIEGDDAQALLVRSQIEFLTLNVRAMRMSKTHELRHAEYMLDSIRQDETHEAMRPSPGPVPRGYVTRRRFSRSSPGARRARRIALDSYVRVWSEEHRAYSRPEWAGHTEEINEAGVWPLREAIEKTAHCGPEKHIIFERARRPAELDQRFGEPRP